MARQLTYRNSDGVTRTLHYGDADRPGQVTVETSVDVEQLIINNRALAEEQKPFSTNKILARIPMTIYERAFHEDWDEEQWKRWLNDPDNKAFRVWPGRV